MSKLLIASGQAPFTVSITSKHIGGEYYAAERTINFSRVASNEMGSVRLRNQDICASFETQHLMDEKNYKLMENGEDYEFLDDHRVISYFASEFSHKASLDLIRQHGAALIYNDLDNDDIKYRDVMYPNTLAEWRLQCNQNFIYAKDEYSLLKFDRRCDQFFTMDDIPLAQPIFDIHLKATEYDLDLAFEHLRDTIALRYAYPNARLTLNYALAGMKNLFNPDFDESDGAGDYTQEGYGGPDFFILNVFPTQEEYEAIWAKALEISPDNPKGTLSDALFELDHMGLRAAGAAYFETYRKDIGYDEPDNPAYLARKQALKR